LQVKIIQFKKTNTNHFQPGTYDINQNLCDIMAVNTTASKFFKIFVMALDPDLYTEMLRTFLKPCPLAVNNKKKMFIYYIINFSLHDQEKWDVGIVRKGKPDESNIYMLPGEYKNIIRIYNEHNQTFYQVTNYYVQ
jgi:hypothetical protein